MSEKEIKDINTLEDAQKHLVELAEQGPGEKYEQEVEQEDPVKLEEARKKLMLMINIKCKGVGQDVILGTIKPNVYKMNISDCDNMREMIKKKGMHGLPMVLKKHVKQGK